MKPHKMLCCFQRTVRRIICGFFVSLFFTAPAVTAATVNVSGNDRTALNNAFTAANPGDTVQFGAGQTIIFGDTNTPTNYAVIVNKMNLTLQGGYTAANFAGQIGNLSNSIIGRGNAITLSDYQNIISGVNSFNTAGLSGIGGSGGTRSIKDSLSESNKWLTTPNTSATAASAGNGLSLRDIRFSNVNVEYTHDGINGKYVNGLIGNNHLANSDTSLGDITGNAFTGINVTLKSNVDTDYLAGGGVVGVRATGEDGASSASAIMGKVSGNIFDSIKITTTSTIMNDFAPRDPSAPGVMKSSYLEGGGLVGVNAASSPGDVVGHALLPELSNNFFTNVHILSNDVLLGGGLVGLNNNSKNTRPQDTYALLDNAKGNIFGNGVAGNIKVQAGFSLRGGGVIGLNGLSSAQVMLENLQNNAFAGISVETGTYIKGGGIVGLQTNDGGDGNLNLDLGPGPMQAAWAYLGTASGNLFLNQQITTGTDLEGGGVIGLRSNRGPANLETLEDNVFKNIDVAIGTDQSGGGIVGLSSVMDAVLETAEGNYFEDLTVNVNGELHGGGIMGVHATADTGAFSLALIGGVSRNTFTDLEVSADSIQGGGIIGTASVTGVASFGDVTNNIFDKLTITTKSNLVGGGILGSWADNTGNTVPASAGMISIADNVFTNLKVEVGEVLEGGGVIGARSNGIAGIKEIVRNQFIGNEISAWHYIDGGGIIGVTGKAEDDPIALLNLIDSSKFTDNKVSADGIVMGGLVYSYGLAEGMIIKDSTFTNNTFTSAKEIVYGAVTVDTGAAPDISPNAQQNTVTLTATRNNTTIFDGNKITGINGTRFNSLYFGTIPEGNTTLPDRTDPAEADAKLIVAPETGGLVQLYDPLWVNQDGDKSFTMEVQGGGFFLWGGNNVFTLDNAAGTVTLTSGSTTTILDGSSTTTYVGRQLLTGQPMGDRYTMSLNALDFTFILENGGRLNVEGHNFFDLSGNAGSAPVAKLNGELRFNLNNTTVYSRGEVPGTNYAGNTAYQPLLTIQTPNQAKMVDLTGSRIILSDFTADRILRDGDRFYLIEVKGDQEAFTEANPSNGTAYARQGMTIAYNFIIDKNEDNSGNDENTRFLVARLQGSAPITPFTPLTPGGIPAGSGGPAEEFETPNNGRITEITFLQRGSDRLIDMPLYDIDPACDPYGPCDPCGVVRSPSGWVRTPFAEVKGTWYRTNSNGTSSADSYSDVRGTLFLGGLAAQKRLYNGKIYLGVFVDAGDADYGTYNHISILDETLRGSGELDFVGGGMLLRRKWNNGLRLDAVLRGGHMKNKFFSSDLLVEGEPTHFRLENAYWGGSIGLDYAWKYRRSTFDVYSRYSWLMAEGGDAVLSTDEDVVFDALHSHRLTSGGRWTRQRNERLSWYVGAAYEYEFDGASRAVEQHSGNYFVLEGLTLRGGTGIGEIGLIVNRNNRLYVTTGLEGYVGRREGGSGFVAAMWKW